MRLRVLRFEVEFCLQTSYKMADFFVCIARRDVVLSVRVDKTLVNISLIVPWITPIEM